MKVKSRFMAGTAGAALLAAQIAYTTSHEGRRYVAYQDSGGIWTICDGSIEGVHKGMKAADAECDRRHAKDQIRIEAGILACTPELADETKVPDEVYIAVNDWAFNVGAGAACKSTLLKLVRAGDIRGACNQFSRWVYVNGNVVRGLVNRRIKDAPGRVSERTLCLRGLR